ncbi:MAG: M50 family metallopeptidase [Pyrinomonadaceae bacterium]
MRYKLADDAKPQAMLLLVATLLTIALWFIPYAEYLVYPIRLFVTFIHEGSHALMAVVTGGSVQSLTIASDGSGVVFSAPSGFIGQMLTSSAGYLGTTVFGVLMLILIRRSVSPHRVLFASGVFVGLMTVVFGILSPLLHIFSLNVAFSSVAFTIAAGVLLTGVLIVLARFASLRIAKFSVAFLAVQCLLNALADLKTVLLVNAPLIGSDIQTDAGNMAAATGIPGFLWVVMWIAISLVVIVIGLRMYASVKSVTTDDSLFED